MQRRLGAGGAGLGRTAAPRGQLDSGVPCPGIYVRHTCRKVSVQGCSQQHKARGSGGPLTVPPPHGHNPVLAGRRDSTQGRWRYRPLSCPTWATSCAGVPPGGCWGSYPGEARLGPLTSVLLCTVGIFCTFVTFHKKKKGRKVALRKKGILTHATWMSLEDIMLSEIADTSFS